MNNLILKYRDWLIEGVLLCLALLLSPYSIKLDYMSAVYLIWPLVFVTLALWKSKNAVNVLICSIVAAACVLVATQNHYLLTYFGALFTGGWMIIIRDYDDNSLKKWISVFLYFGVTLFFLIAVISRMPQHPFDPSLRYFYMARGLLNMKIYAIEANVVMVYMLGSVIMELSHVRKILNFESLPYSEKSERIFLFLSVICIAIYSADKIIDNYFFHMYGSHTSFFSLNSGEEIKLFLYFIFGGYLIKITLLTTRNHKQDLAVIRERERDISNMMDKLKELNEELDYRISVRTNQLDQAYSDIESFSYTVSHELKTPIHEIRAYTEFIEEDNESVLTEQSKEDIKSIYHVCDSTIRLIQHMMVYSKIGYQAIDIRQINMKEIVEACYAEIMVDKENRKIDFCVDDIPDTMGDRFLLKRMIFNIISNSVKFTNKTEHASIKVTGSREGEWNVYVFKDNGAGFDMDRAKNIFGMFERYHNRSDFEGSGVGLATVKKIVDRFGGKIELASSRGNGCSVSVYLPVQFDIKTQKNM